MKKMTTFKDVIRSVIDVTVKRTEKIDASAAHSNKKTSQLKSMAIEQAGRMRERSESLNSLKNGFAEVRHAIADTGIYHHLLKGKIREVDKLILSAYKVSDIFGESASPKEFNKKLKQKETEYISKSQAEFGNKNSKLGKEYLEIATAIGKIKVFPESWYWFKLTDTELKSVSSVTSENKEKKMEDKVSIGAYNYIDVAKKLMADDYHIRRALGLCMLSGRRMSEMMVTGDFCATDDGNLLFSGAIKKDSLSLFSSTDEWHEIPSMIDADEFVHFFKKLRDDKKIQEVIELCKNQKKLIASK
ncbi:protelomerase family protein (plasmid) [Vibrio harveyi]|uniref:protelomerase family protein n=1 Tax=Vibrio harveyi TaxID=669 RepID=UPI00234D01A0|nr:protelomerase family protein [Vibrio harveyi]WCP84198.1 protelomerase family protein [Vibrio harveyi]